MCFRQIVFFSLVVFFFALWETQQQQQKIITYKYYFFLVSTSIITVAIKHEKKFLRFKTRNKIHEPLDHCLLLILDMRVRFHSSCYILIIIINAQEGITLKESLN